MNYKENQFVKLPTELELKDITSNELAPRDKLVYVCIRKYMNNNTGVAHPSLATIAKDSSTSVPTVKKSIKKLEDLEYLSTYKDERKTYYKFNPIKYFEPFSYDFLNLTDINYTEKSFLVAAQQYMLKDEYGVGKIAIPIYQLAEKINMNRHTVTKCIKSLEDKGYLSNDSASLVNYRTGKPMNLVVFNMEKLFQGIIWIIKDMNNRIDDNSDKINQLNETINHINAEMFVEKERNDKLNKRIDNLEKLLKRSWQLEEKEHTRKMYEDSFDI